MQILIMTFRLEGIEEDAYLAMTDAVAPAFTQVPGLIGKAWLADHETNTYGGVYTFASRGAAEAYLDSEIVAGMRANPHLAGVTARLFGVIEPATRVTQGALDYVPARAAA